MWRSRIPDNCKYALRLMRRSPAVTAAAVLAAGLGIGAAASMYTIVDGVLLRPLPFPRSEQLVNVWETNPGRDLPRMPVAPGNYYDWCSQNRSFSAIGAYQMGTFNLASGGSEPERFIGATTDAGFFTTLQVAPMLGRVFTAAEDQPGHDDVIVLSYGVWRQRFGGDPGVLGRKLTLDSRPRTVIGVMPEGFEYPALATMWAPLALDGPTRARRDFHRLRAIARLADAVTLDRARADMRNIAVRLEREYPDLNKDESAAVNRILDDLVGDVRPALHLLLAAVGCVLLIACANIANLLLAKASGRQKEIAIRASLGAGRAAIFGQMLTESLLLAMLGGAAGVALAYAGFDALVALAPANVPRLAHLSIDLNVLWVSLGLAVATGILFGLAPAWYAARVNVNAMLKEGMRGTTSRSRLRSVLVAGQVAIALILVASAGLLARSFHQIARVDAGFNPEGVMTMRLAPAPAKFRDRDDLQGELARGVLGKVETLAGVHSAAIATDLPLLGNPIYIMRFEGRPPVTPSQAPVANYFAVTPGFFATMGMRITRGRAIADRDAAKTPLVAVVNQTLVDRYFAGQDPVGKRLEIAFDDPPNWREIVGVVADAKINGLDRDTPVQVYTAYMQKPGVLRGTVPPITVLARTAGDPALLASPMRHAILSVDRSQPVFAVQPMTEIVGRSIAQRRVALILLAFFAVSAVLLAAVGVYGVMSFHVAQRTGEIGIRIALGAHSGQVAWQVEKEGMGLAGAGLVLGAAGSLALTRYLGPLLFRVDPRDPEVLILAAAVLAFVALAACYLPARRAARVDPIVALRFE